MGLLGSNGYRRSDGREKEGREEEGTGMTEGQPVRNFIVLCIKMFLTEV